MRRTVILQGGPLSGEHAAVAVEALAYILYGVFPEGVRRFVWVQRSDDEPHMFDYKGEDLVRPRVDGEPSDA